MKKMKKKRKRRRLLLLLVAALALLLTCLHLIHLHLVARLGSSKSKLDATKTEKIQDGGRQEEPRWRRLEARGSHQQQQQQLEGRKSADQARVKSYFRPKFRLTNQMIDKLGARPKLANQLKRTTPHLLHLHNLTFVGGARPVVADCGGGGGVDGGQRRLLIVVNSKWSNFRRRQQLRATWLATQSLSGQLCAPQKRNNGTQQEGEQAKLGGLEYVFVVGLPPNGGDAEAAHGLRKLEEERRLHGDLVLVNLADEYRAMSLKHLAILKWLTAFGKEDDLVVLKCDDDAYIRLRPLLDLLESTQSRPPPISGHHDHNHNKDWLMCARFQSHSPVLRQPDRKWALTRREWPWDTFPAYCSGLAYLAPARLLRRLLIVAHLLLAREEEEATNYARPLWVDDVFVTGVLLSSLAERPEIVRLNRHFCYWSGGGADDDSNQHAPRCLVEELRDPPTQRKLANTTTHLQ